MNVYKISKGNWAVQYKAATLEDAQNYADSLGQGYVATFVSSFESKPNEQLYEPDKEFLKSLFDNFNLKNRPVELTDAEKVALDAEFSPMLSFVSAGSILKVRSMIAALTPPIGTVYTLQRQTEDLAAIDEYLSER